MTWLDFLRCKLTPIDPPDSEKLELLGHIAELHDDKLIELERRIMELEKLCKQSRETLSP